MDRKYIFIFTQKIPGVLKNNERARHKKAKGMWQAIYNHVIKKTLLLLVLIPKCIHQILFMYFIIFNVTLFFIQGMDIKTYIKIKLINPYAAFIKFWKKIDDSNICFHLLIYGTTVP